MSEFVKENGEASSNVRIIGRVQLVPDLKDNRRLGLRLKILALDISSQ